MEQQATPTADFQPKRMALLSADVLKIIAITAMFIDHTAWMFIPTNSALGIICHIIGRTTIPIMCYLIAEGFFYTRNVGKYALRLFIFALVSHLPFFFFQQGSFAISWGSFFDSFSNTSVIWSLFLGLVALIVLNAKGMNIILKLVLIAALCVAAIPGNWSWFAVLWVVGFSFFRGKPKWQFISFSVVALLFVSRQTLLPLIGGSDGWAVNFFQLGLFLTIPLLLMYNSAAKPRKSLKWVFYIFYPLHLLILVLIKVLI